MARRSKPPETPAAPPPSQTPSILINEKQLTTLLKNCRSNKGQVDELVGDLRSKIAYAVEKHNLHKKAFGDIRKMDRMEPEQLLEYWTHLTAMMDLAGLTERMQSVQKLGLEEDGDDAGQPANVESLADRRGRRNADEGERAEA